MAATTIRDPTPMQTIEEVIKEYPEKIHNVRSILPKIPATRDIVKALTIRYSTALTDISTTTGEPVEIDISYSEDTVDVVDLSAKSKDMLERYFTSALVKQQTKLVLRQFLYNENKIALDTLSTAPVENITVDTSADTTEPDVNEVTDAIDYALDNISMYTPIDSCMIISSNVAKLLLKKTPEAKKAAIETLKENNVKVIKSNIITNTAYIIPKDETVSRLIQVDPLEIKFVKNGAFDLACIFGREAVAYQIMQPEIIQKLDFTIQ